LAQRHRLACPEGAATVVACVAYIANL